VPCGEKVQTTVPEKRLMTKAVTEKMAAEGPMPTEEDLINLMHDIAEGFKSQAKSFCIEWDAR